MTREKGGDRVGPGGPTATYDDVLSDLLGVQRELRGKPQPSRAGLHLVPESSQPLIDLTEPASEDDPGSSETDAEILGRLERLERDLSDVRVEFRALVQALKNRNLL